MPRGNGGMKNSVTVDRVSSDKMVEMAKSTFGKMDVESERVGVGT